MTRLRTGKLAGVKGVRRKVTLNTNAPQPTARPAVHYGQWAIHRSARGYTVTHAPTGLAVGGASSEDSVRRLAEGLLAVRNIKTMRATMARAHCLEIYQQWKRGN